MKKIFIIIALMFSFCLFSLRVSAQSISNTQINTDKELARVTSIGQRILSSNNLPTKVTFFVSGEDEVNAHANIDNEVHVYNGLLKLVENDEELAAVISHEIAHIVNKHVHKQSIFHVAIQFIVSKIKAPFASKVASGVGGLTLMKASRSAEYEADLTGVDLMIGANYNPQAMISFLSKIAQNYIDIIQTHPSGNKRLENIYDYLSFNYPETLKYPYNTDSYLKFQVHMNSVLQERNSDPKKIEEHIAKQTKLRDEKLKRAEAMKKGSNMWASAFNVLLSTPNPSN